MTFSRAFEEFSRTQLPQAIHEAMVKKCCGPSLVGHLSRDSTPIQGREKAAKKEPQPKKPKARRGRPKKGEVRPPKDSRRLPRQLARPLAENLEELSAACDGDEKRQQRLPQVVDRLETARRLHRR